MKMLHIKHADGFVISAELSESAVQAFGQHSNTTSNGYTWYSLPVLKDGEFNISISLCFYSGKLIHINLSALGAQFGSSWDDFTEEKEFARVKETNAWLAQNNLKTGTYSWGTVYCGYDQKAASGYAAIWLFCNQNVFLGQPLSMIEFATLRQLLINVLGTWEKADAKQLGFTRAMCDATYQGFPESSNAAQSLQVICQILAYVIDNKNAKTKLLLGNNIHLKTPKLKQLFSNIKKIAIKPN
jgi:hypothetical protein